VRNILSLLLALIILLSTLLFGCFYINISGGAKFERTDKKEEKPAEE
jgi:hypothetical protein|tara:strand:- start:257 stop:397 length:141 start_codon:yes stop_codon:yes gene_type:complete